MRLIGNLTTKNCAIAWGLPCGTGDGERPGSPAIDLGRERSHQSDFRQLRPWCWIVRVRPSEIDSTDRDGVQAAASVQIDRHYPRQPSSGSREDTPVGALPPWYMRRLRLMVSSVVIWGELKLVIRGSRHRSQVTRCR